MKKILNLLFVLLLVPDVQAQVDLNYYLPDDISYDSSIPTPQEVLGYQVGEWHVGHDQLIYYMRALAASSDRIKLEDHGTSYEKRPLIHLIITSPKNHSNLEELREQHIDWADPAKEPRSDPKDMPAVLWMGYCVHGNEASSANSALLVAYYLAAAQGAEIEQKLDEMIILLDPCYNPDGTNRFASWVNTHRGIEEVSSDPNDHEHSEVWPGGRTNHFWFDLNRDWLLAQHPESQSRIRRFHHWKPNWLTDHHEMGTNSTFFFQPGIPSRNNPMTPPKVFELSQEVANYHAKALDKIGSLYYSRESYDDFYFGKGSTYPDINGSVGILFEQASSRGHRQDSDFGVLEFPFTIRNQFVTSLSTLEGTHANRTQLLEHQREFFVSAMELAAKDPVKAYVWGASKDKARSWQLANLIRQHQIDVYRPASPIEAAGKNFTAEDSYIVPLNQKQYRLIKTMFDKVTSFQDSLFYDVSTWTMPLAFNTPYAEIKAGNFRLGEKIQEWNMPEGQLAGGKSDYAYAFEWHGYYSPKALYAFQEAGLRAYVAGDYFTESGGKAFGPGSIMIPVANQDLDADKIYALAQEIAKSCALDIYSIKSGQSVAGVDLGSRTFSKLDEPKIILLVEDGVSSYEAGEAWHALDQRYHIPVSKIRVSQLGRIDLSNYTNIIMPNGNYSTLNKSAAEKIKAWVSGGGNIVAWKGSLSWLKSNNLLPVSFVETQRDTTVNRLPYGGRSKRSGAQAIGGAIFETSLDLTHPLAYGYEDESLSVFRNHRNFLERNTNPYAYPLIYTEEPLQSGYISKPNLEKLAGTAAAVISNRGRGTVVYLADNPNFRAYWYGTNKLFMNAIFFANEMNGGL